MHGSWFAGWYEAAGRCLVDTPPGRDEYRQPGISDRGWDRPQCDAEAAWATMALNRGFSAPIVQSLGGWKIERMMKRYAGRVRATRFLKSSLRKAAPSVAGTSRCS